MESPLKESPFFEDPIGRQMRRALASVIAERHNQDAKWGDQSAHPDATWLAILTEEVGEAGRAILEYQFGSDPPEHLREELVQVAAVAVAWIEAIDRRGRLNG